MKVLLIVPNIRSFDIFPSISVASLKGFINEKTVHQAKIVDMVFNKNNWRTYISDIVERERPDLIGFSVLSFNYPDALEIAQFIKKRFDIKIIFGGVHVILSPKEVIQKDVVDIICNGEGEEVLLDLLDNALVCDRIKGIWFKRNGKIIKNKPRELIQDLDSLGFPDFSDFKLSRYFPMNHYHLPIMGSRGCPYDCTFCSNHVLKKKLKGKYVRFRGVESIITEIDQRIKQYCDMGMKFLYFFDDTFILYKDFVDRFCRRFREENFDHIIKWTANVRANLISEDIVKTMKKSGCYEMRMGVESGNAYIRNDVYQRNMGEDQLINAFEIIKKQEVLLRLDFIIGAPYETMDMMDETFDFARKSGADNIFFARLYPFPGTEIKKVCKQENTIENQGALGEKGMLPVKNTKFVSENQIDALFKKIVKWQGKRYFYKGLQKKGIFFLFDIGKFMLYNKHRYLLEMNQIYRWNVQRYILNIN
jgi:radical SAM superfamily enzyme YgiQ (UPF0313 family)